MLRKLILTSAATLTLAAPLSVPAAANAGIFVGIGGPVYYRPAPVVVYRPAPVVVADPPPVVVTPAPVVVTPPPPPVVVTPPPPPPPVIVHERRPWHVQYRGCAAEPWREYAAFAHRGRALDVQSSLARRGYEVRVVHY
jgi:hypothetical protein